jgi:hypothetical protein
MTSRYFYFLAGGKAFDSVRKCRCSNRKFKSGAHICAINMKFPGKFSLRDTLFKREASPMMGATGPIEADSATETPMVAASEQASHAAVASNRAVAQFWRNVEVPVVPPSPGRVVDLLHKMQQDEQSSRANQWRLRHGLQHNSVTQERAELLRQFKVDVLNFTEQAWEWQSHKAHYTLRSDDALSKDKAHLIAPQGMQYMQMLAEQAMRITCQANSACDPSQAPVPKEFSFEDRRDFLASWPPFQDFLYKAHRKTLSKNTQVLINAYHGCLPRNGKEPNGKEPMPDLPPYILRGLAAMVKSKPASKKAIAEHASTMVQQYLTGLMILEKAVGHA